MKKLTQICIFFAVFLTLSSFEFHKFYVGIYQINYASSKKMLEVTTRIFTDDLNDALEKKYHRKFHLTDKSETPEDVALMQKYIADNFVIKVNGKSATLNFRSKESEGNVFICYFNVRDIPKIKSLEITNKILFDFVTEQQNIIQTTVHGKKNSLLLTIDNPKDILQF